MDLHDWRFTSIQDLECCIIILECTRELEPRVAAIDDKHVAIRNNDRLSSLYMYI